MADAPCSGRKFRTFNVTDEYKREALRIGIDTRLPAVRVIRVLTELVNIHGAPLSIRLDNEPGFIAKALADRAASQGYGLNPIQPGKPAKNAYLERFSKTCRVKQFPKLCLCVVQEIELASPKWDYSISTTATAVAAAAAVCVLP